MEVVFSITSTSPICMSVPKTTQGSRRRVLDRIYKIIRIRKGGEHEGGFGRIA